MITTINRTDKGLDFTAISDDGLYMLERCESRENGTLGGFEWVVFDFDAYKVYLDEDTYEGSDAGYEFCFETEAMSRIQEAINDKDANTHPIYRNYAFDKFSFNEIDSSNKNAKPVTCGLVGVLVLDKDTSYTDDEIENIKLDYITFTEENLYSYDVCIYQKIKILRMPMENPEFSYNATGEELIDETFKYLKNVTLEDEWKHQCSLQVNSSRVLKDLDYFIADAKSVDPKCLCIYREAHPFIAQALVALRDEVANNDGK